MTPQELNKVVHERVFGTDELVEFTGVDAFSFRNWLKRGVVDVGEKHRVGRWLFSPADMIRVSTMVDLVEGVGLSPAAANSLADAVIFFLELFLKAAEENYADPDWNGNSPLKAAMENYVVLATVQGTKVEWGGYYWTDEMQLMPSFGPKRDEKGSMALLSVTHVSVGAGLIIEDIMIKVRGTMSSEA